MHDVNWLAVLVAGLVPMVVGYLWYGLVFGKQWLALMETTAEEIQANYNPLKTHGPSFIMALITAYILAQLLADMGGSGSAMAGVHVALMALIGFVLPVASQSVTYEGRKTGLFVLGLGYNGVALIGQAVVLAAWT